MRRYETATRSICLQLYADSDCYYVRHRRQLMKEPQQVTKYDTSSTAHAEYSFRLQNS